MLRKIIPFNIFHTEIYWKWEVQQQRDSEKVSEQVVIAGTLAGTF